MLRTIRAGGQIRVSDTVLAHFQAVTIRLVRSFAAASIPSMSGLTRGHQLTSSTLNMQRLPLKCLVADNSFQPEGTPHNVASNSTAILIIFLSDEQHSAIQHIHIGLVVCCVGCEMYEQKGILPFIQPTKEDLKKVWQKWESGKDPSGAHSYVMLVANYGSLMAMPTDLPYCLVYPTIYSKQLPPRTRTTLTLLVVPLSCEPMH